MQKKPAKRQFTNCLFMSADDGLISWEEIAISALLHMPESQVKKMAFDNGLEFVEGYSGTIH